MPHIDDGTLHAYLDGALHALADAGALQDGASDEDVEAHLRACADCRARLDAERDVRERAGLVLHDARPAVIDVPPFEYMDRGRGTRRRSTLVPAAWAASVVLALGAGWIAGELLRRDDAGVQSAAARADARAAAEPGAVAPSRPSPEPAAVPGGQAAVSTPQGDGPTGGREAGERTPASRGAAEAARGQVAAGGQAEERVSERLAAATGGAAGDARMQAREAPSDSGSLRGLASVAAGDAAAAGIVTSGEVRARLQQVPVTSADGTVAGAASALRSASDASRTFPAAPAPAAQAKALVPPGEALAWSGSVQTPLDRFRGNLQQARSPVAVWLPLSADDRRRSETPVVVVAGAGTPQVEAALLVTGRMLRVRQRLDSGELVDLLVWRAPAPAGDSAASPGTPLRAEPARAAEAGGLMEPGVWTPVGEAILSGDVHEVIVHDARARTWIALSGPLPAARLRQLADLLVESR